MLTDCIIPFLVGLCWGSFLHAFAVRIVLNIPLFAKRSRCTTCHALIAWYDNIPLISWLVLRGKCRSCSSTISVLYPSFELLTGIVAVAWWLERGSLLLKESSWALLGLDGIFISALLIAAATDLHALVIPQLCTLWLVPVGLLAAYLGLTNVSVLHSAIAAVLGYSLLWAINFLFRRSRGHDGIGVGDMELLAMIGAFLGLAGIWITLLVGSWFGLLISLGMRLIKKIDRQTTLPFGPSLAAGALIYLLWGSTLLDWWLR